MTVENVTLQSSNLVAGSAILSPLWLPSLSQISSAAALILPILGVIWLMIQIGFYLYGKFKK